MLTARSMIESSDILFVQLEAPIEMVVAFGIDRKIGVRKILDPAPVLHEFPVDLFDVGLIFSSEAEAAALVGGKSIQSRSGVQPGVRTREEIEVLL